MRALHALPLILLAACPGDDSGTTSTTISMTSAASTTDTSGGSGSTGGSVGSSSEGGSMADTSTGSSPSICDECDPFTELCFESIIDGPSEFSCRTIPALCTKDPTCDCIVPIECPESLQACNMEGELVIVECVEG